MESESAPGDTGLPRSTADENGVAEALGRLCDMAALRRPDDPLLVRFLPLYYSELPAGEIDDRKVDDIYAVAVIHLSLARVRAPGEAVVRVVSPDRERDGWHSQHSVLFVVTDDMPFLVDTTRLVLDRMGLGVHLLVHPMLTVQRDEENRLTDVASDIADVEGIVEAWTQIEIDRTDEATAKELERAILAAVEDVRRVVEGFPAMRQRMEELGDVDPILPWFAAGQFVFLGSADYDVADDGTIRLRPGSELGLARDEPRFANPRPMPRDRPVMIARTDATARVFRADRQAVIAVTSDGGRSAHPLRRAAGHQRLPGERARDPRRRRGRGRRPRPQRGADALAHRASDAHGAREPAPRPRAGAGTDGGGPPRGGDRRLAGAPAGARVRGPRAGRPVDHGARVPAAQPVHRGAARAHRRRRRHGVRRRPADVRAVPRRQLAGPHRGERAPPGWRRAGRPGGHRTARRRAVDVVVGPPAGRTRGRRRRGGSADPVRARRLARPARLPGRRAAGAGRPRRAADRRAPRHRRRPVDVTRARRRRAGGGVALPRLPPGRAGGTVRAAAVARPPRSAGARRAAIHVRPRRRAGLRLRHRGTCTG